MPSLPDTAIGALLLVAFALLYFLGKAPGWRAAFALVGTILLAGLGFVGHVLTVLSGWLITAATAVTGWLFGSYVPLVLTLIVAGIFIHDMWPKQGARKRTGIAGIVLGALIVAGATGIPALNHLGSAITGGVNSAKQIAGG